VAKSGVKVSGLAGEAFVAIWHDIVPEGKEDFYEWHNREHMPERVGVPGFRRGRRYIAQRGSPEYFNLYEVETPEVLTGQDYLGRLNNPTPWTRRAVAYFRNVSRSLCRVGGSYGCGQGGLIMTWRFDTVPGQEDQCRRYLAREALLEIVQRPGIVGAHFGVADRAGSEIVTEEKKSRGSATLVPGWIILLEGISATALDQAAEPALGVDALRAHGAADPIEQGVYRLECSRAKTAFAVA
jgi:hypothetical protein